jgi:SPP1 family predicted phage head-tail adaptor
MTFQAPVTTFAGANKTPTTAWVNVKSLWGEIAEYSGQEVVWEQQVQAEQSFTITCRWFPGVRQRMRVLIGDRIFNINGVKDIQGLHHVYELDATEMHPEI